MDMMNHWERVIGQSLLYDINISKNWCNQICGRIHTSVVTFKQTQIILWFYQVEENIWVLLMNDFQNACEVLECFLGIQRNCIDFRFLGIQRNSMDFLPYNKRFILDSNRIEKLNQMELLTIIIILLSMLKDTLIYWFTSPVDLHTIELDLLG